MGKWLKVLACKLVMVRFNLLATSHKCHLWTGKLQSPCISRSFLTSWYRETRGRSIDRGFDIPRAHVQGHHTDGRLHRRHRRHSQAHEQVHVHSAPQGQHHHGHEHHSRERRSSSQNRIPNITIHTNGQTYTVPSRPNYQHYSAAPVHPVSGTTVIPPPGVRPSHSANHLQYSNAAAARMYIPVYQLLSAFIIRKRKVF